PGSLRALATFVDGRDDVGAVSPRLASQQGAPQPTGAPFPTLASLLTSKLLRLTGRQQATSADIALSEPLPTDWVSATTMLCHRRAFDAAGGLDEALFLYYEDCDFCLRLRKKGRRSYVLPGARAVHHGGASFGGDQRSQLRAFRSSEDYYFRKHRPSWESRALRLLRPVYDWLGLRQKIHPTSASDSPGR